MYLIYGTFHERACVCVCIYVYIYMTMHIPEPVYQIVTKNRIIILKIGLY